MYKFIGHLVIGALSFEVLIPLCDCCCFTDLPRGLVRQDITDQRIHFEPELFASDRKSDGTVVAYNNYVSNDGVGVFLTVEKYRSATRAKNALRRRIKKATRIIERGVKLDKDGQRVGERAVLLSRTGLPQETIGGVVWADGAKLYAVESPSLKHALEFEKQNYR